LFYLSTDSIVTRPYTFAKDCAFDVQSITMTPSVNLDPGTYFIGGHRQRAGGKVADTTTANNSFNLVQVRVPAA
jgi:hypothetical protein